MTVKLQVGQASDGTWFSRRKVGSKITAHGADYNCKADAVRGISDDAIAVLQTFAAVAGVSLSKEAQDEVRKYVRKNVEVLP